MPFCHLAPPPGLPPPPGPAVGPVGTGAASSSVGTPPPTQTAMTTEARLKALEDALTKQLQENARVTAELEKANRDIEIMKGQLTEAQHQAIALASLAAAALESPQGGNGVTEGLLRDLLWVSGQVTDAHRRAPRSRRRNGH